MEPYVQGFVDTPVGPVPQIATTPNLRDRFGNARARFGPIRKKYRVNPGLYAVGCPDKGAPVLVTANYKLSFDALRFQLTGIDCWLLVADSRGINVWCAAGKRTFATDEIVSLVARTRLAEVVSCRTLILPQLGAGGVSAPLVKKNSGFSVIFGPVRAQDLQEFLHNGAVASEAMRTVTFTLSERAVLTPVELYLQAKMLLYILVTGFLLSGIGPHLFSLDPTLKRTVLIFGATLFGLICGSVLVPLLLPWLPCRQFWLKGLWPPLLLGGISFAGGVVKLSPEMVPLFLWALAVSSFQAMNFTGSTPFTSPSGVEYEMRRGLPVQITLAAVAVALWLVLSFL